MNPTKIYIYNDVEPVDNEWWEKAKRYAAIITVNPPRYVNGVRIQWAQHIADLMRICIMYQRGGIYLDTDLILLKHLRDILKSNVVTMCQESDTKVWNGFIASPPQARFFKRWMIEYETKYGSAKGGCWWAGLSVETPMRLYNQDSDCVNLVDVQTFLPFGIHDNTIYGEWSEGMYEISHGIHLWETEAEKRGVLPKNKEYFTENPRTAFTKIFGKFV